MGMRVHLEALEACIQTNNPCQGNNMFNYMKTKYDLDLEAIAKIPDMN
ncbi:MAG: hypothetical protein ACLU4N_17165 [Butyricimonas faecihominis]